MKFNILTFIMALFVGNMMASNPANPTNFVASVQSEIDAELEQITLMDHLISESRLTFDQLTQVAPELVESTNLLSSSDFISSSKNNAPPLGIPGFVWGLVLGWVGMLIVYLTMDEGAERKKQVMNALWGCIAASVLWLILYFIILGSIFSTVMDSTLPNANVIFGA